MKYFMKGIWVLMLTLPLSFNALAGENGIEDCRTGGKVRWPGNANVTYRVHPVLWDNPVWWQGLHNAVKKWNDSLKGEINVSLVRGPNPTGNNYKFDNGKSEVHIAPLSSGTIADARYKTRNRNPCHIKEADIRFDITANIWENEEAHNTTFASPFSDGMLDIETTMIHELGHTFAMKHDNRFTRIMNTTYPNTGWFGDPYTVGDRRPFALDIKKLRQVYGIGTSTNELAATRWTHPVNAKSNKLNYTTVLRDNGTPLDYKFISGNLVLDNNVSPGDPLFLPYEIHNLSTGTRDLEVKFYLSTDRNIGSADDTYLGLSYYTLSQGISLTGMKYITLPNNKYLTLIV